MLYDDSFFFLNTKLDTFRFEDDGDKSKKKYFQLVVGMWCVLPTLRMVHTLSQDESCKSYSFEFFFHVTTLRKKLKVFKKIRLVCCRYYFLVGCNFWQSLPIDLFEKNDKQATKTSII